MSSKAFYLLLSLGSSVAAKSTVSIGGGYKFEASPSMKVIFTSCLSQPHIADGLI